MSNIPPQIRLPNDPVPRPTAKERHVRDGRTGTLMTPAPIVDVAGDAEALASRVASFIAARVSGASGRFGLSLSGGSAPKRVYELPGGLGASLDWRKVHLFWGDERFVPPDHRDSNFRMAREALIDHASIPAAQVPPIPTTPLTKALDERDAWVTSIIGVKPEPRISLTYPALQSSRVILFVVSGAKKRDILARVLAKDMTLPAARLATLGTSTSSPAARR
ncbi:MAG: 6-phosphogluconolactonase [Pseudomonadota bacterium]|nr:6-phosphogluconolactonase [Pseudomonadota bacterium]